MKLLIFVASLLFRLSSAYAQFNGCLPGICNTPLQAYIGPGDIVSGATAWYGLRGYNAAYASPGTNKAINVRRQSDSATKDIVITGEGNLDVANAALFAGTDATASCSTTGSSVSLVCTGASSTPTANDPISGTGITQPAYIVSCGAFVAGGGTCTMNAAQNIGVAETVTFQVALFVTEAYDQTGAGNHVIQATQGTQPQLLLSCINSVPCLFAPATASLSSSTPASSTLQPYSVSTVVERTSAFTTSSVLIGFGATNTGFATVANTAYIYGGGTAQNVTAADSAAHALQVVFNGASSSVQVDGTPNAVANPGGTATGTGGLRILSNQVGTQKLYGYLSEAGFWALAFNSSQILSLHSNQSAWYGTP